MSKKTLLVLAVLLAVLVGGMWMTGRRAAVPAGKTAAAAGALLSAVDMSTVKAIVLDDGASTTHLAQVDGNWCVAEQENYPADFTRLRAMMLAIDGMGQVQIADEGTNHLAEYGLEAGAESSPMRIALEHGQGTTVLSLGKMREPQEGGQPWGPPPGRYARVDEGPVLLLKDDIAMAQSDSGSWWDRELLSVAPESIRKVEASSGDGSYAIERGTNGTFMLAGAEGKEVDAPAANRLFGALRSLRAEQILPGAGENDARFTNAVEFKAVTEDATYFVHVGEARSDEVGGKPVEIEVAAAADATPEQQAAAALVNKKLNNRTFLIPAYLADSLCVKKADVMGKPAEPAPEPPPVPAEVPAAESTAPETGRIRRGREFFHTMEKKFPHCGKLRPNAKNADFRPFFAIFSQKWPKNA